MPGRATIERRGKQLLVVKRAATGAPAGMLKYERDQLRRLGHPQIVRVAAWSDEAPHAELATVYVGPHSFADLEPDWEELFALSAAAAAADLHRLGVVHGRLTGDHILVDSRRRPVLCSLGHSGPSSPEGEAADCQQLGETLAVVGARARDGVGGREIRRRIERWHRVVAALRRGTATATDAASQFSELVGAPGPDPNAGVDDGSAPGTLGGTRTWRGAVGMPGDGAPRAARVRRSLGAGVLVLLCLAGGSFGGGLRPGAGATANAGAGPVDVGSRAAATPVAPDSVRSSSGRPDSGVTPVSSSACGRVAPAACQSACRAGIDADGDGCADDIEITQNTIRVDDRWYRLGEPGDRIAVGDWDCDGVATPAVLRPSTGQVYAFVHWGGAERAEARPLRRVVGAVTLHVGSRGGCEHLVVTATDGRIVEVEL